MTKNTLLLNHALIEWFENTIREITIDTLERNERYIGHSVAAHIVHSVGAGYRLRSVYTHGDCLEEEKNLQPIYFLEFYDYGNIIDKNKEIFQDLLGNPERWANALRKELARIRNAIRHSRGGYLSDRSLSNLMAWCEKLQEINEARRRWVRK